MDSKQSHLLDDMHMLVWYKLIWRPCLAETVVQMHGHRTANIEKAMCCKIHGKKLLIFRDPANPRLDWVRCNTKTKSVEMALFPYCLTPASCCLGLADPEAI